MVRIFNLLVPAGRLHVPGSYCRSMRMTQYTIRTSDIAGVHLLLAHLPCNRHRVDTECVQMEKKREGACSVLLSNKHRTIWKECGNFPLHLLIVVASC